MVCCRSRSTPTWSPSSRATGRICSGRSTRMRSPLQAISAHAPHPNAAKLWMEYLYSDEGQLGWLKGYCHPIRFNNLAGSRKVPADMLAKLPPAVAYSKALFPSLEQQDRAKQIITKQWDSVVGANVK